MSLKKRNIKFVKLGITQKISKETLALKEKYSTIFGEKF
jgi:hypothetical protein